MGDIDYSRIRSVTTREIVSALQRDGFLFVRQVGSHRRFHHPDGRRVTIPYHQGGQTFRIGTLRSIVERQAKWTRRDLERLRLLD